MKHRTRKSVRLTLATAFGVAAAALIPRGLAAPLDVLVTIENLAPTNGTLLTPVWVGFHDGTFDIFSAGGAASPALERLAEDGDTASLDALFTGSGSGSVSGTLMSRGAIPPFAPGQKASLRFRVDSMSAHNRYLSYASMVIPSNDAFVGNDSPTGIPVFDAAGHFVGGSYTVMGEQVLDAGTEMNDELPMNTAFLGQAAPNTGTSEGGVVGVHPGFKAAGMGGILDGSFAGFSFSNANFKAPGYAVAKITITRVVPVTVTVQNLAPTNGTLLTPVWVGFHNGMFDTFSAGTAANPGLERLAEDGETTPLTTSFAASGYGSEQATIASGGPLPPLAPGQRTSRTIWLDPDVPASRYFSYASMVIPSNDAFVGNDDPMRHPVFDGMGKFVGGSFTVMGEQVFDAGTEMNDELPMNTAFLGQAAPNTGASEGGVVGVHPGFKAAGMGGILDGSFAGFSFSNANFKAAGYRVARITLSVPQELTVTVENLAPTNGTLLTPIWVGFHDGTFNLYDAGAPASAALERLAEDGDVAPLNASFASSGAGTLQGTIASGGPLPPLAPGQRARLTLLVDPLAPSSRYLSYASMVIPSNDAFIGNDDPQRFPIFDGEGNFLGARVTVMGGMVRDSGTEMNDEVPANTAFLGQAAPNTGVAQGGTVGTHPGFQPAGSGGVLDGSFAGFSFSAADFKAPNYAVARITVSKPRAVNLTVENLAPARGTYLTPVWVGFHDGSFDLFDTNAPASSALERIAEDGDTGPLSASFTAVAAGQFQATVMSGGAAPVFAPGQHTTRTFWLDPLSPASRFLSYASMVIPSNDAFIGNGNPIAMPVFDTDGTFVGGSVNVPGLHVWDAGTEVNDELPANTAFFGQMAPNTGVTEGGVVRRHSGFKAPGQGGILDAAMFAGADFTVAGYQVAHIGLSAAPWIQEIRVHDGVVRLAWVGGEAPFRVERRDSLSSGMWSEVSMTTESLAEVPISGPIGFFRVVGR
jgi:hypothetical protein